MCFWKILGAPIRSSDSCGNWLPNADDCGNFFAQFAFCPKSLIARAKSDIEESQGRACRHPLALAYEFQELLEGGLVDNRAEIARRYGLSRARVTQVTNLLNLPEAVRDYVRALPAEKQRCYSGRRLRQIAALANEQA